MPSASYLRPLVAPLRFLAQSDFARLSTVKGLDGLVRTALQAAREAGSGGDVQLLERVARALVHGGSDSQEALRALAPRVREAEADSGAASNPKAGTSPGNGRARGRGTESTAATPASTGGPAAGPGRPAGTREPSVLAEPKGAPRDSVSSG